MTVIVRATRPWPRRARATTAAWTSPLEHRIEAVQRVANVLSCRPISTRSVVTSRLSRRGRSDERRAIALPRAPRRRFVDLGQVAHPAQSEFCSFVASRSTPRARARQLVEGALECLGLSPTTPAAQQTAGARALGRRTGDRDEAAETRTALVRDLAKVDEATLAAPWGVAMARRSSPTPRRGQARKSRPIGY